MSTIQLHKKHGLNPTLCTCFYCGKPTGEIALLGAHYDGEAPQYMCTSIEPCNECKEKYKDFVLLVEATQNRKGNPQPTGRWLAIKKECVAIANNGIAFVDVATYSQLISQANAVKANG